jgi:hypothetical protein
MDQDQAARLDLRDALVMVLASGVRYSSYERCQGPYRTPRDELREAAHIAGVVASSFDRLTYALRSC